MKKKGKPLIVVSEDAEQSQQMKQAFEHCSRQPQKAEQSAEKLKNELNQSVLQVVKLQEKTPIKGIDVVPYKIHSFAETLRSTGTYKVKDPEKADADSKKQNKPGNVVTGLGYGGKEFIVGFYDGITGVVTQPYKGAKENGVKGALKGVGKGMVGLVSKPLAGTVDFISCTTQGVVNTPGQISRGFKSIKNRKKKGDTGN